MAVNQSSCFVVLAVMENAMAPPRTRLQWKRDHWIVGKTAL